MTRAASHRPVPERIVLEGRSVTLEPLTAAHATTLWPAARDAPESWRWLPVGPFNQERQFQAYLRLASRSEAEVIWAVRPNHMAHAAGWLALLDIRPADAAIELGNIWFPPGLSRTRAATEALFLMLRHAFDDLGYRRVGWKCNARNTASRHAAERLGFRLEGVLRAHMIVKGEERDSAYFSMLDTEWADRRPAFEKWLADDNFDRDGHALTPLARNTG